jgi:hypothetical protein
MKGFKEDFEAWRGALTPEEKALVQKQAKGDFDKNFRKSDEFKVDLPEEKIQSFSKILGKFFEAEVEDYKKDSADSGPDPDGLLFKGTEPKIDFGLKGSIVEVDRDADRRYQWSFIRTQRAALNNSFFPMSSPLTEPNYFVTNDTESKDMYKSVTEKVLEAIKAVRDDATDDGKAKIDDLIAYIEKEHMGDAEVRELHMSVVMKEQLATVNEALMKEVAKAIEAGQPEKEVMERALVIRQQTSLFLWASWLKARKIIEDDVEFQKGFYASQKDYDTSKTKADLAKEIHAAFEEYEGKKLPPLDEDVLADLEKIPAVDSRPYRHMHPWGYASKLYKSEAIDAFGFRYLLGIFETVDEAKAAFVRWNDEYKQANEDMETELAQWSKQEQARLDADVVQKEAVKIVMAEKDK